MQSAVVERPYQFIPPNPSNAWPTFIQRFKLFDIHLRRREGVVDYEIRHAERFSDALRTGDGILVAPNHCRYADPLVVGWLARKVNTHVFAMASWHLFTKSWFDSFSIRCMGGFSIWREGTDRQSLETAVDILTEARRPLVLFAEGSAHKTNDRLQTLLDGAGFIARTAARRRQKETGGRVQMLPVGIKYAFQGDISAWANASLANLEQRLTWQVRSGQPILERITRVAEGLLAIKEVEYLGKSYDGPLVERQQRLLTAIVQPIEQECVGKTATGSIIQRVKALRPRIVPRLLDPATPAVAHPQLRSWLLDLDLAQQMAAYPNGYLTDAPVTDTRVLETLERLEEDLLDEIRWPGPLKAIIEVGHPILVPPERQPRGEIDPLLAQLNGSLSEILGRLQHEARLFSTELV